MQDVDTESGRVINYVYMAELPRHAAVLGLPERTLPAAFVFIWDDAGIGSCISRTVTLWAQILCCYRRRCSTAVRRSLCHGVCVCLCVCWHYKTKTPDRNDLKFGPVVVLGSLSKPTDFDFKSSRSWPQQGHFELLSPLHICRTDAATKFKFGAQTHYRRLLPADQSDWLERLLWWRLNAWWGDYLHKAQVEDIMYFYTAR